MRPRPTRSRATETADKKHCATSTPRTRPTSTRSGTGPRRSSQCLDGRTDVSARTTATGPTAWHGDQGLTATMTGQQDARRPSLARRLSSVLHRHPRLRLAAAARGAAARGWSSSTSASLAVAARRPRSGRTDVFTGDDRARAARWTTSGRLRPATSTARSSLRTVGVAAAVTVICAVLAFPMAFFMAKVASPRVAAAAGRRRAHPAVGQLPGQGLRLAGDAGRRRRRQLGARAVRAATARASG